MANNNDSYVYASQAGAPGCETGWERVVRERFWRSLGKKIRKGARVSNHR